MRWILLINALAVVLLAGSVAIVVEGTRFGAPVSVAARAPADQTVDPASNAPAIAVAEPHLVPSTAVPPMVTEVGAEAVVADEVTADEVAMLDGAPPTLPVPRTKPGAEQYAAETELATPELVPETMAEAEPAQGLQPVQRRLRVVTEGAFPPFNYLNEAGELDGFDVATVMEVCRRIEAICTVEALPWDDLQPALLSDTADIIAASLRIETVPGSGTNFSEPYYAVQGRFVGQRAQAGNLLDMINGSAGVAVQGGTIHAAYLRETFPSLVPLQVANLDDALDALKSGKVGLVFADNAAILEWLKTEACCVTIGNRVEHPVLFGAGVGFALRTVDETLKADIDAALMAMKADGTLEQFSVDYVGGRIF